MSSRLPLILFAYTSSLMATDYYVNTAGNDSAAGTSTGTAWQSLAKLNNHAFAAGDRIFLAGGQTFSGNLAFTTNDTGTAANPIVVDSYGTGTATISAGTGTAISILNTAGIKIYNLRLVGGWDSAAQSGNIGYGVDVRNTLGGNVKLDTVHLENIEASGFREAGIQLQGEASDGSYSGFKNVTIRSCVSHDNGDAGIQSGAPYQATVNYSHQNVLVDRCIAYNNRGIRDKGNNSGNGIVIAGVDGAVIQYSIAYNNGELSNFYGGGPVGIWFWDTTNGTIQFCESYNNKSSTLDGGGFDLDGGATNCVVQYNYSHGNKGTGFLFYTFEGRPCSGNIVRYNISENDSQGNHAAGVYLGGGSAVANNKIYHNTIVKTGGPGDFQGVYLDGVGAGNSFYNNIFYNGVSDRQVFLKNAPGTVLQGNAYWSTNGGFRVEVDSATYTSLSAFRAAGYEKNGAADTGLNVNPQLVAPGAGGTIANPDALAGLSAYKLLSTSPLINAALNLTASPFSLSVGNRDYYNTTLPQNGAYEIGAYEGAGQAPSSGDSPEANAVFELEPSHAPGKRLDVSGAGTANGTNVQIWTDNNGNAQRWLLDPVSTGVYELAPLNAGDSNLDVSGVSSANGANVQIWADANGNNQRWSFEAVGDGTYEIIPQHATGMRLDVSSSGTGDGSNVQIWADANGANQRWRLYKISTTPSGPGPNLVTNPGFESGGGQSPVGWWTASWAGGDSTDFTEGVRPRTGSTHLTHWNPSSASQIITAQTKTGLANGLYTMRAWVIGSNNQNAAVMFVRNHGSAEVNVNIKTGYTYTQYTLADINVTNGQAEIGFYSDAAAGQFNSFDDVEFFKQ